jgi:putative ABC transport system ATP-binding protein
LEGSIIAKNKSLQLEYKEIQQNWSENLLFWIKDLYHIYKTKYIENVALEKLNFQIYKGEIVSVAGPSGSGKTTLMNIIGGLLIPSSGRIYFQRKTDTEIINISNLNLEKRSTYRLENIGYVFQKYNLFDFLTVEENLHVPLLIRNQSIKKNQDLIDEVMHDVNIEYRREYSIKMLSGGEKQRLQVGMALMSHPRIILADEPTGNLDHDNSVIIFDLLKELSKKYQTTILIASHDSLLKNYVQRTINLE